MRSDVSVQLVFLLGILFQDVAKAKRTKTFLEEEYNAPAATNRNLTSKNPTVCKRPKVYPGIEEYQNKIEEPETGGTPLPDETVGVPGDLCIRFNKFQWVEGAIPEEIPADMFPLDCNSYPLSSETVEILRRDTYSHSVTEPDDYMLRYEASLDSYIRAVGGFPHYPNSDSNAPFWGELRHVVKVQIARANHVDPKDLSPLPSIWYKNPKFHMGEMAALVHDEWPGNMHGKMIHEFAQHQGAKMDPDIIPQRGNIDFVRHLVALAGLHTYAIETCAPINFLAKWTAGLPRPEEIAMKIKSGELGMADGVPEDIVYMISRMDFKTATEFTAYPEGSPNHPSWPAMHSASSSASFWLDVVMNLTDEQRCQVRMMDWGVSYARTVAGVHYPMDNIAGLNLGQEIISRHLVKHLKYKYGADPVKVQAKIDRVRFDWRDYNIWDCFEGHDHAHYMEKSLDEMIDADLFDVYDKN